MASAYEFGGWGVVDTIQPIIDYVKEKNLCKGNFWCKQ